MRRSLPTTCCRRTTGIPTYNPRSRDTSTARTGQVVHRLYYAGAGGTLFYVDRADTFSPAAPVRRAFYGLNAFQANPDGFSATVFINTPLTTDGQGNVFFGFRVQGTAPAPLSTSQSGFARVAPDGTRDLCARRARRRRRHHLAGLAQFRAGIEPR